jgi:hypothetical protein
MSKQVLTTLDFNNVGRIANLPDAVSAQDPVTLAQLNAVNEGLAWKDSVRVASTGNINTSSPGASIDGISLSASDRVLLKDQSSGSENGIYIWNGAAVAMTRATDASTFAELESAIVTVEEGTTNGGTTWRQTVVNGTIGSTTNTWTTFGTAAAAASETVAGVAELATQAETDTGTDDARIVTPLKLTNWSGRKRKATGTLGDGAATQYTVTHNFGTRDTVAEVYRNSGSYDKIECDVEHATTNTTIFRFASAPTSAQFAYVIIG